MREADSWRWTRGFVENVADAIVLRYVDVSIRDAEAPAAAAESLRAALGSVGEAAPVVHAEAHVCDLFIAAT